MQIRKVQKKVHHDCGFESANWFDTGFFANVYVGPATIFAHGLK